MVENVVYVHVAAYEHTRVFICQTGLSEAK